MCEIETRPSPQRAGHPHPNRPATAPVRRGERLKVPAIALPPQGLRVIGSATRRSLRGAPPGNPRHRPAAAVAGAAGGFRDRFRILGSNVSRVGKVASAEREDWHNTRSLLTWPLVDGRATPPASGSRWPIFAAVHGGCLSAHPSGFLPAPAAQCLHACLSATSDRAPREPFAQPRSTPTANPNPPHPSDPPVRHTRTPGVHHQPRNPLICAALPPAGPLHTYADGTPRLPGQPGRPVLKAIPIAVSDAARTRPTPWGRAAWVSRSCGADPPWRAR
ncbi:hypothetical protein ATK36_5437 [Amycolatopsis sulphurea]|uniref:Uncharacterized protein n=1 Tax=Amycolatopsis sulphurea TaxID=76022 RepID=A0A2A9FFS1_9PSEU|nr:hypothetical protein ATK36_5437 [Amycolatopsis sulphurea]